jgi:hypothetical protein
MSTRRAWAVTGKRYQGIPAKLMLMFTTNQVFQRHSIITFSAISYPTSNGFFFSFLASNAEDINPTSKAEH